MSTTVFATRRVVVVDDKPINREGRCSWLLKAGFGDVVPLDFRDALAYDHWREVHTLVVDGLDTQEDRDREPWLCGIDNSDPTLRYERYMGVRVVDRARRAHRDLVIVVVSSYVDRSPAMVERFHEVGADYIYSHRDTHSGQDFVDAVTAPAHQHRMRRPSSTCRAAEGFTGTRLQSVIDVLGGTRSDWDPEVVAAVRMVLVDGMARKEVLALTGVSIRSFERCMDHVKRLLQLVDSPASGALDDRRPRVERAREAITRLLGRHHPQGGVE